jgi:hypothetical protein
MEQKDLIGKIIGDMDQKELVQRIVGEVMAAWLGRANLPPAGRRKAGSGSVAAPSRRSWPVHRPHHAAT